jgi:putative glutamine amidotransferase
MSLTIGISKGSGSPKYANYRRWLEEADDDLEVIDLAASSDLEADMARIDGLVLTGGSDVDPERYGRPELVGRCEDIDRERDARELRMLDIAEERELPVLGICRGLQVLNVHRGGTLIAHIPDFVEGGEAHQKDGDVDRRHSIDVVSGTLLLKAAGQLSGEVNSAHHQAIDELGGGLVASARSSDGVIEAVELSNRMGSPYVLAVQWHPERMEDRDSGFASGVREQFLFEARSARILSGVTKPLPKPDPEVPETPPEAPEPPTDPLFPIIQ